MKSEPVIMIKETIPYKNPYIAFFIVAFLFELLILFMYGFFIDYTFWAGSVFDNYQITFLYSLSLLIVLGFGLLPSYFGYTGWSAMGYTLLITSIAFQLNILYNVLFTKGHVHSDVSIDSFNIKKASI
jgi:hypothetical protein